GARARGDIAGECWAALCRATVLWWNHPEGSRAATNEAMALSERVTDPLVLAHARSHAASWHVQMHGCRIDDVKMAEEAVRCAVAAGDRELVARDTLLLALFRCARPQFPQATPPAHLAVH